MTCPLINTDRAQLQSLDAVAASIQSPRTGSAPGMGKKATPSTPATGTVKMESAGTLNDMVVSHCAKMPQPNGEARNRSIRLHLILAAGICSGDDA